MMMALGGEEKERKERKNRKKEKNKEEGDSRNRRLPPFAGNKSGHLRPRFRYHSLRFLISFPFI